MKNETINDIKERLFGGASAASGTLGAIGSVPNICHSLCVSVVSLLAVFGVTLNILPLMFLQTYQIYFWLAALLFTGTSYYFYRKQRTKVDRDRFFLILNLGLLLFGLPAEALPLALHSFSGGAAKAGLPFSQAADYMDVFRFAGGSLVIAGIFLVVPKFTPQSLLFTIVIAGFLFNQYLMYRMGVFGAGSPVGSVANSAPQQLSHMKLTSFDVALAKERMDKNNDGICDGCGMPIQQCIDTGQIDCDMGNNPDAMGILGSQHIHADMKVYIHGQPLDFAKPEYHMRSSFLHFDDNQNKEDASSVLHMHAKKVPLWLFFRSLGMNLTRNSLTLADGRVFKNENSSTLKFYLFEKKVDSLGDYVFQDLDKLLISFGPGNDLDIDRQIQSVTNFAKDHRR